MDLYLVKMFAEDDGEEFLKIGVSKDSFQRFKYGQTKVTDSDLDLREKLERLRVGERYISDHPYGVEMVHRVTFQLEGQALHHEAELLEAVKSHQYWPKRRFTGQSECFTCSDEVRAMIVKYMDREVAAERLSSGELLRYQLEAVRIQDRGDKLAHHRAVMAAMPPRSSEQTY